MPGICSVLRTWQCFVVIILIILVFHHQNQNYFRFQIKTFWITYVRVHMYQITALDLLK